MKYLNFSLGLSLILVSLTVFADAFASVKPSSAKKQSAVKQAKKQKDANLSRDVHFTGATINGKYQDSAQAVVTVENEKTLRELISARRDFKDRLARELKPESSQEKE